MQPRFSPDGKKIAFTSDAGGGDNIWTMNPDGSEAKQITKENFRLLNNPAWLPDGEYFVCRKHFSSTRSLGAGEIWMYHHSGGQGIQLTKRKNDQQDVNEPTVSPDGRYVYFSEDVYPGGFFQYNKDPNDQIYIIKRYDRDKGKVENFLGGAGSAMRPQISRDGKKLAFVRRIRTKSVLYIYDMETGQEFPIYDNLSKDQSEAWCIFGVYTGFDWTPDDQNIIIWANGKINKINIASKKATNIPFTVNAKHRVAETVQFKNEVAPDKFDVKVIRQAVTSPDGKTLVFNALGQLYKMSLPNGKPKRMTDAKHFEYEPAFSEDGKQIVYTSWDDIELGAIHIMNVSSGSSRKITEKKGIYRTPQFSPDGKMIVYRREGGNTHQGYVHAVKPGIYTMTSEGKDAKLITASGENPRFNVEGDRIYFQTGGYIFGSLTKAFKSINLDGKDEKKIFNTKYTNQFIPSPDNKWIAFTDLYKVFVAPMPLPGQPIGLSADTKAVPVAQVARDAGINLHWSGDSKTINWTLGNEYFSNELTDRFTFLEGAVDSIPPIDTVGLKIPLKIEMDIPEGKLALTGARIITMEGDEVIEDGVIIIDENRIEAIGSKDDISIPSGAKEMDMSGKTIMPGIVDAHAHLGAFRFGLSPQKHWQYYANLALSLIHI